MQNSFSVYDFLLSFTLYFETRNNQAVKAKQEFTVICEFMHINRPLLFTTAKTKTHSFVRRETGGNTIGWFVAQMENNKVIKFK